MWRHRALSAAFTVQPTQSACSAGLWHPISARAASGHPLRVSPAIGHHLMHIGAPSKAIAGGSSSLEGSNSWDDLHNNNSSKRMSTKASSLQLAIHRAGHNMASDLKAPSLMHRGRNNTSEPDVSQPLLTKMQFNGSAGNPEQPGQPNASGPGGSLPPMQDEDKAPKGLFGWQYLVALAAISVVICYADRSNISTAVLPMAEAFNWDKAFQGIVLSSFFSGYALTQVLGGQLADRVGGKIVLAGGVTLWSLFTLLTPEAAAAGTIPLIAARVLLGVGEGVAFPSIHSLIARNVPYAWQSTAVGLVTAASYVGTALAFGISPMIISKLGWQWVFYLFAGMALLWLPLWIPVRTNQTFRLKPAGSTVSTTELPSTNVSDTKSGSLAESEPLIVRVETAPSQTETTDASKSGFWALMKRKEVWAICAAQYCQSWGMYGLLTWLPTFFKDFYHVEIADLAAYTLAPYVVQGGLGLLSGVIADKMLASGWGVRPVRILLQVVGMLGPAACLMLAVSPAVGASPTFASQLITVGLGFSALTLGGVSVSHLDIAPKHAGVIFGAGNTTATLAGLLSVPFTGFILQSTGSWPLVFGITAAHYVVGAALWAAWVGDKPLPEDEVPATSTATGTA